MQKCVIMICRAKVRRREICVNDASVRGWGKTSSRCCAIFNGLRKKETIILTQNSAKILRGSDKEDVITNKRTRLEF